MTGYEDFIFSSWITKHWLDTDYMYTHDSEIHKLHREEYILLLPNKPISQQEDEFLDDPDELGFLYKQNDVYYHLFKHCDWCSDSYDPYIVPVDIYGCITAYVYKSSIREDSYVYTTYPPEFYHEHRSQYVFYDRFTIEAEYGSNDIVDSNGESLPESDIRIFMYILSKKVGLITHSKYHDIDIFVHQPL